MTFNAVTRGDARTAAELFRSYLWGRSGVLVLVCSSVLMEMCLRVGLSWVWEVAHSTG